MRLTIVNLFMQGEKIRERKRSAGILARKPGELNPPYAGRRDAAEPEYRVRGVKEARRVIPSPRRTPGPITTGGSGLKSRSPAFANNYCRGGLVAAVRRTTRTLT